MSEQKSLTEKFLDLVDTVAKLRDPETGCPWDLKQNHQSLLPYLIEEAYEYSYAVENQSAKEQLEELGDVLLQVIQPIAFEHRISSRNLAASLVAIKEFCLINRLSCRDHYQHLPQLITILDVVKSTLFDAFHQRKHRRTRYVFRIQQSPMSLVNFLLRNATQSLKKTIP